MSASIHSVNGSTSTNASLYKAAVAGDSEVLENYTKPLENLLIGKNNNTILHLHLNSPCRRSKDFVEKVLAKSPHLLWQINNDGDIPMHIAARYGHVDIVKLLVEEAKKPIHRDMETGEEEGAVRRMLRSRNKQNETALHLTITRRANSLSVVKEILEHEDPCYTYTANTSGESPLYRAASRRLDSIAVDILNKFESPDCSGPNGTTVFHFASIQGEAHKSLFDSLFQKLGSFVNQADQNGWTPLHYAAYLGRTEVVEKILEKDDSSVNETDNERNQTALHLATIKRRGGVMKEIIDRCPECCEITDKRGWNVLHYAAITRDKSAITTVMKDPSLMYLITVPDMKGYTPLHLAMAFDPLLDWLKYCNVPPDFLLDQISSIRDQGIDKKKILKWTEDLGVDPFGRKMENRDDASNKEIEETIFPEMEKAKDSHLVAATLVATATFAAAFTLPGGYISDESESKLKGTPILSRNVAFEAFVVADALAMVLSLAAVLKHFIMVMLGYKQKYYWILRSAFWFVQLAIHAMVVAFITGTYVVLAPNSKGLAISICIIGFF